MGLAPGRASLSYGYDLAIEPTSFTFPSLRVQTTQYDTGGRVSTATATYNALPTTYGGSFGYFPDGTLANVTLGPSAQVQQYCQNNRLQIVGVRLGQPGGSTTSNCANSNDLLNLTMAFGSPGSNDGNLTGETIVAPLNIAESFTYDAYNRISKATEGTAPAWSQTYNYDAYGNRWVTSPVGFTLYQFTPTASNNYNANNQLAAAFNNTGYDHAGNQNAIGGYTFTYDAENRLYSSTIGGATTDYTYDGESRRVTKATSGGTTTAYVYDARGEVAAEYSTTPPPQVGTLYLTPDHLGSTRLETNELGAAVAYHDYLPFGEEIPSGLGGRGSLYGAADGITHKFTSKERDTETGGSATEGLDYFGERYLSSTQGRFSSPDEVLTDQSSANPQSWNLYNYVRNNPLINIDPSGQDCITTSNQTDKSVSVTVTSGSCNGNVGAYVPGTVSTDSLSYNGTSVGYSYTPYTSDSTLGTGTVNLGTSHSSGDISPFGLAVVQSVGQNANGMYGLMGTFAGGSLLGGAAIAGGLAISGAGVTTLGLQTAAATAPLLPAVPSALQKLQRVGLTLEQANDIIRSPATQKLIDNANDGNINCIQQVGDKVVRITTDPTGQRIISAGFMRANSIVNGLANGRFTAK